MSAKQRFDVVVVGAGPAGACAAAAAAENGVSVLLLEEHAEVGVPLACAEGLSRSTIQGYLEVQPGWVARSLSGSIVRSPRGREFTIEYPNVGWVMDRKVFDPALAERAQQRGAVVKLSCRATGIEDNEISVEENGKTVRYQWKYLIGADGVATHVGSWMDIDTRLGPAQIEICAQYLLSNIMIDADRAYLIFGRKYAPGGYAWIFPKSATSANVGLGLSPVKTKEKPKTLLDHWVMEEFPAAKIEERVFSGVPAKRLKRFSGSNFCLVGDAARFTDPLSGAGIANAIKSGTIAGRNAARVIRGQKHDLENEIKKEILDELDWHYRVRNVYLRLDDEKFEDIFRVAEKIFHGSIITDINTRRLVKQILLYSPHLLKVGFRLLF
ncbi:NAD(P)/FAD-dependent oxidoreductase [candidate division WOR-3 bacterium]|nr:NAD(P)/FAD-dependent oxidoreductase [candidate division WOR-3 bacterium]